MEVLPPLRGPMRRMRGRFAMAGLSKSMEYSLDEEVEEGVCDVADEDKLSSTVIFEFIFIFNMLYSPDNEQDHEKIFKTAM